MRHLILLETFMIGTANIYCITVHATSLQTHKSGISHKTL